LFLHRWGKGKKGDKITVLATGRPATIKWLTVGGRTSAFVPEVQTIGVKNSRTVRKTTEKKVLNADTEPSVIHAT